MWLCSSSTSIIEDRDLSAHLNILTIRRHDLDRESIRFQGSCSFLDRLFFGLWPEAWIPASKRLLPLFIEHPASGSATADALRVGSTASVAASPFACSPLDSQPIPQSRTRSVPRCDSALRSWARTAGCVPRRCAIPGLPSTLCACGRPCFRTPLPLSPSPDSPAYSRPESYCRATNTT